MSNAQAALVFIVAALLTASLAAMRAVYTPKPPVAVNGIGVFACGGLAAIVVTRSDGSIAIYDAQNEPNEAQTAEALSVPESKRKSISVPCLTLPAIPSI